MITENIDKKYPQKKQYSDLSAVRAACLFVVKALNKLVEEMNNQVYFDFDQNGLILRATDKDSLQRASNKLEHWKEQTSIGILTDSISKEDYKKFIDSDLQSLLRQERAFINVISFDKFLAACEFLEKKGYKEPRQMYEEIQAEKKNFALLMCTKHRFKEIKERIEAMLEPLRKIKKKKKITSSLKLASTWDDVDDISIGTQALKQEKDNVVQPLDTIGFQQVKKIDQQENEELAKEEYKKELQYKIKESTIYEIVVLEIEQWLNYFPEILQILEESEKIKKQDDEKNFNIQLISQHFQAEETNQNHYINNNSSFTSQIEVGFLQLKILKETLSNEQIKLIDKIKLKCGSYLDHILQNKPKEFVNYLFSEMEPEEREYFQVHTLRQLLNDTTILIDNYQSKPQISQMSTRKRNIIFNLKKYIEKFKEDQLVVIENDGTIYNQYFLIGIKNIHKLFAETVDRTEMMFAKACATNFSNQNHNNRHHSESDSEHLDHYESRKYSLNGNDLIQINEPSNNDQINQHNGNNQNHQNQFNSQNYHHNHNHHNKNANNSFQQDIEMQIYKAAVLFLQINSNQINSSNGNNSNPPAQLQQDEIALTQVESSQLIPHKSKINSVEFQNHPYYLKKFQEQVLEYVIEIAQKNKMFSSNSCIKYHKIIQINSPQQTQDIDQSQQNYKKEFGILMDRKEFCLKYLIEEGFLFSVYQQIDISMKIVKCLHELHNQREKRGAHCNLKPNNIMLDMTYNVYLSDMGIDPKKNASYYYQFENNYQNSLIILKNKLKNQFLKTTDQIIQTSIESYKNQHPNFGVNNQNQNVQNFTPDAQFKQAFTQNQNIFLNQLADLQALGLILYEIFTGQSISAENYFLKNHRQFIKRTSQESPTPTLKMIFSIIFNLLELQITSTEEIIPQLQEILNKF
ncbi:hypothetical protein TTHERM_00034990 (macronuclear) [Tetrahymena thermophila SB210]|uniref:Protein kinase domain-containing protein n=1 Tax=Tetrahymena thermophila (strain SB210) TaxID=312017 RepID=Q22MM0_TETTS|nr:hypothetical protein TTHERM_00034990 [Tetrahymena thermophila SB210]EAR86678.2 hypothetical protein TTHERM_00034990 [Tetrahymena thermophila SB210]|eukprot:XP_977000.2 hypothetical protein TTHERM_00034990 [Tetrahymena thermophila SB210]